MTVGQPSVFPQTPLFQFGGFGNPTVRPPGEQGTAVASTVVPQYVAIAPPAAPSVAPPLAPPLVPLVAQPPVQPPNNPTEPIAQAPVAAQPDLAPIFHQLNTQIQGQAALMNNNLLIGTIESYNGVKNNVEDFIRSVQNVSALAGWNDATTVSVALIKLKGLALEHVQMRGRPQTWNDFKALLRKRFAPPSTELTAFSNLVQCQQKAGELVAEFAQRLQLWCSKSELVGDGQLMLRFFLSGLRPQIRNIVLMKNPTTFEEALNQAQYAEGCEALTSRASARTFVINSGGNGANEIECYYCHRLGHIRRNCDRYVTFRKGSGEGQDRYRQVGGPGPNRGQVNFQRQGYAPERREYQGQTLNNRNRYDYENNQGGRRNYRDGVIGFQERDDRFGQTDRFNTNENSRQRDSGSDSDSAGSSRRNESGNNPNANGARPLRR